MQLFRRVFGTFTTSLFSDTGRKNMWRLANLLYSPEDWKGSTAFSWEFFCQHGWKVQDSIIWRHSFTNTEKGFCFRLSVNLNWGNVMDHTTVKIMEDICSHNRCRVLTTVSTSIMPPIHKPVSTQITFWNPGSITNHPQPRETLSGSWAPCNCTWVFAIYLPDDYCMPLLKIFQHK